MNLKSVYYIGQTIAVFVVIATLFALLGQSRQANRIARADMTTRLGESFNENMRQLAADKDLAAAFRAVMFGDGDGDGDGDGVVDAVSLSRVLIYFNLTMHTNSVAYHAVKDGLVDPRYLDQIEVNTSWYLTSPQFRAEWRRTSPLYTKAFVDHIDTRFEAQRSIVEKLYGRQPAPAAPAPAAPS